MRKALNQKIQYEIHLEKYINSDKLLKFKNKANNDHEDFAHR